MFDSQRLRVFSPPVHKQLFQLEFLRLFSEAVWLKQASFINFRKAYSIQTTSEVTELIFLIQFHQLGWSVGVNPEEKIFYPCGSRLEVLIQSVFQISRAFSDTCSSLQSSFGLDRIWVWSQIFCPNTFGTFFRFASLPSVNYRALNQSPSHQVFRPYHVNLKGPNPYLYSKASPISLLLPFMKQLDFI